MDQIPRLSEILYVGMCREIGTPTVVTIRRDVKDMEDMLEQTIHTGKHKCEGRRMLSGSQREGFRFKTSDQDYLMWYCGYKVINNISQIRVYSSPQHDIVLMDDTDTPPGFVRLQLLTEPSDSFLMVSINPFHNRFYISSHLWRECFLKQFSDGIVYQNVTVHGPCSTGCLKSSGISIDRAVCFTCNFWPGITRNWMERCLRHKWPPVSVLKNILNNGFHCVPIGSKYNTTENGLEWRLSFSLAELKLAYTMNHTQLICYGLLKIFLKEVINNNVEEPLLCSYFLKTTVFWLIQVGHLSWCPNNLLECFWMCFKYLILCVYRGKFANFFIPQNNMFLYKIVGVARESLLEQLNRYYRIGVACLLHSPTLRAILESALSSPSLVIPSTEKLCSSIQCVCADTCILSELHRLSATSLRDCFLYLNSLHVLIFSSLSSYQSLTLQYYTADFLVLAAFMIVNNNSNSNHKHVYFLDRKLCNMLKLSTRIGSISHSLYLAMYYYRTRRYLEALRVINMTKGRLSKQNILYQDTVDRQNYSKYTKNLSLSRKMKNHWVANIKVYYRVHYIEELSLNQGEEKIRSKDALFFPPFLLVDMLSVLSNYRLGNKFQYLRSLEDLQTLLLYDNGMYVPLCHRATSWYILGICQQTVGDVHGALDSYQESLRLRPNEFIEKAIKTRINNIRQQLM